MAMCHKMRYAGWLPGLLFLLVLTWGLPQDVHGQEVPPEFEIDAVSVRPAAVSAETQVDLYTRIPYSQLKFINTADGFTARYDITVEAIGLDEENRRQNLMQTRIWEGKVVVDTYMATQADDFYDFTTQTLDLLPGNYILEFQVADRASSQVFTREIAFSVRNLNQPIALSDLTFVEAYDKDKNTITPSVSSRIGSDVANLKLFYEIYTEQINKPIRISQEVVRLQNGGVPVQQIPTLQNAEVGEGAAFVYTKVDENLLEAKKNQYIVTIPLNELKVGGYVARVRVEDETGQLLDTAEKPFAVYWSGLDEHIEDISDAVSQLQYIAKKKELSFIKEGRNDTEQYERFMEFWKKRDPTPGTRRNERMEEYYYRVAFANSRYSKVTEGWKTDRGFVMVRFGEPDHIERHPYSFNTKPYEIWYYYRIGRQFIFVDKTGLGDYELHVPVWDERTRIH